MLVIAHYHIRNAFLACFAMTSMVLCMYWMIIFDEAGYFGYLRRKPHWAAFNILAMICGLWFLFFIGQIIYRVILKKSVAIWIDDGHLIMTHRKLMSVEINEIDSVRIKKSRNWVTPYKVIILTSNRRGDEIMPLALIRESPEEIIQNISPLLRKNTTITLLDGTTVQTR
jgi:hypothetical protein